MSTRPRHSFEFGPYRLDTAERLLLRDGEPVPLTPKAFETLVALVERSGHLVEKDELMKVVWSDAFVEESNLTNNVYALRKILGDGENGRSYIETVPKRGYRFTAPVKDLAPDALVLEKRSVTRVVTEETIADDSPEQPVISAGERKAIAPRPVHADQRFRWEWLLVALLSLSLIIGGIFIYRSLTADRSLAATPRPQITSIAVLPFLNESGDPDAEYLADGISEGLINNLSQLKQLKVIARTSSFTYKKKPIDLKQAASALQVEGIVTGRIARSGDNLLVSVELIDARDNKQLWGEQYNRRDTDAVNVQAEISREIARTLRSRLLATDPQQPGASHSVRPEAYDVFIRGRYAWRKADKDSRKKAVEYFRQAIEIDPNFALAYADLAASYEVLYSGSFLDPKEFRIKAEAAAQKALELDDNLADGHYVMASLRRNAWDWATAEREYQRAIELNPSLAEAHYYYAYYLLDFGRFEEAVNAAKRARGLDPLAMAKDSQVAFMLIAARRYDEASDELRKIIAIEPNSASAYFCFGFMYVMKGMYAEAIKAYGESMRLGYDSPGGQIYLAAAYAKAGARNKAEQMLNQLETTKEYVSPAELAVLYAALDQRERAFASLEKAYAAHDLQLQFLYVEPFYENLRQDPRFQSLLGRVGLPTNKS